MFIFIIYIYIPSDMLFGTDSDILSDISSDILSAILSDIDAQILCGQGPAETTAI